MQNADLPEKKQNIIKQLENYQIKKNKKNWKHTQKW